MVRGTERRVPAWELLVHTPAVFVRVASKGFAGYGTWKSVRKLEDSDGCNVGTSRAVGVSAPLSICRLQLAVINSKTALLTGGEDGGPDKGMPD